MDVLCSQLWDRRRRSPVDVWMTVPRRLSCFCEVAPQTDGGARRNCASFSSVVSPVL